MSSGQEAQAGSGFGTGNAGGSKRNRKSKRKPGHSNHGRERQPLGRDPDYEAICARQTLGLALSGRLTEQLVKRVHKALAVQHHPDKGGDPRNDDAFEQRSRRVCSSLRCQTSLHLDA